MAYKKPRQFATLGEEQKVQYLAVLADKHSQLDRILCTKEIQADREVFQGYLYELYLPGNIEGKLLRDGVTDQDVEYLEMWKKQVEEQGGF